MAKISIINTNSAMRKLKRFVKLGVAAAAIYGAVWTAPKIANQYNLSSNRTEIQKRVENRDYEGALELDKKLRNIGFFIPYTGEKERILVMDSIKSRKTKELEEAVTGNDYSLASQLLGQFKGQEFFSVEDIRNLEAKVQGISPQSLMKQAESAVEPAKQLDFYLLAEREFGKSKEQEPTLRTKIISVSLKDIEDAYYRKMAGEAFQKIDRLAKYLEPKNDSQTQVRSEDIDRLFDTSNIFMRQVLLEGNPRLDQAKEYLTKVDSLAGLLGVKDRTQRVRALAQIAIKQTETGIGEKRQYQASDVTDLDRIAELSQVYSPETFGEIVELYLTAQAKVQKDPLLTKSFLDSGLMQVELLPVERQREFKTRIADGYIGLARTISDTARKDAYLMLQTARGLYFDSGLKQEDKKITELDSFVHSNFGSKSESKLKN
jgi:hypothetical protein